MNVQVELLDQESERMTEEQIRQCDFYSRVLHVQKEELEDRKKEASSAYASQIKQINSKIKTLTKAASKNNSVLLHDSLDDQEIRKILGA